MSVETGVVANDAIIDEFKRRVEERVARQRLPFVPRGAHPKAHGIVRAEFRIEPNLASELRTGIFARAKTYPAYVRFSNSSGDSPKDSTPDARGMAIKVMGVEGEKLLDDERKTQDFLLVNFPAFVAKSPEEFHEFLVLRRQLRDAQTEAARGSVMKTIGEKFPVAIKAAGVIRSPFTASYFSQTPYALGSGLVVKYCARPRQTDRNPLSPADAEKLRYHYLRLAMKETLDKGEDAVFDFMVQRRVGDKMRIDDPTQIWDENVSPFEKVATVVIFGPQTFESAEQVRFAETISYNPWHSLKEHLPLGSVNESRREVYVTMLSVRRSRTSVEPREPTGEGDF